KLPRRAQERNAGADRVRAARADDQAGRDGDRVGRQRQTRTDDQQGVDLRAQRNRTAGRQLDVVLARRSGQAGGRGGRGDARQGIVGGKIERARLGQGGERQDAAGDQRGRRVEERQLVGIVP